MQNPRFLVAKSISYSGLVNYEHCPRYYENVNLKLLKPDKNSPDMAFGTLIHKYTQDVLEGKLEALIASVKFTKTWNRFDKFYKLDKKYKDFSLIGEKIILYIQAFFKKEFGNFKVRHIEFKIEKPIENFPQFFKGYIDIVLELENGKIVIIDLKTSNSFYSFEEYRDKIKDYQLTLYKKYYSELHNLKLEDISTYFIVFEKKLESKKPINIIEIGSSNKKVENAEAWLNQSLRTINNGKFMKKLTSCRKYGDKHICTFYRTPNCP